MASAQGASHCRLQTIFYSCNFCNFETRHLILFERHVKRCSSQSAASASNAASQSTLPAPSVCRNYKCSKCSFVSNKAKLFLYHQRQEHGENIAVYGCNECEYASRHKNKVLRHKRLVHKVVSSSDTILALEDQVLLNSPAIENDATVKGAVENTDVPSGSNVIDQVEIVKQFLVSGQKFQVPSSPSSCSRNDERLEVEGLDCVLVSDRRARWIPYSVNAVDGLYQCKFCRYSNPHKWKIASHMRTSHSRKTSYKCSQCNFATARKIEWCAHKSVHSGKAIYSCGECAYQTTMKRNFERHQERHLVNGPRRCSLCSYSSTGEGAIQRHMAEYHPPSPGKTDVNFSEETPLNEEANAPKGCCAQSIPPDDQNSVLQQSSSSVVHQPYCSMAMSVESNCLPTPSISTPVASVLAPSFSFHDQRATNSFPCQNQRDLSKSAPPRAYEPRWTCSLCPLGYKRAADLNRHMKRKHGTSLKDVKSSGNKSFPNNQTIVTDNAILRSPSDTNNCSSSNHPSLPVLSVLNMKCASNVAKCSSGNSSSAVMVLVDEPLNLSLKKNDRAVDNWVQCEVLDLSMKSQSDRLGNDEVIPNYSYLSTGKILSTVKCPLVNYSCGEGCRCLVCTKNMQLHILSHKSDELSILPDAHVRDSIASDSPAADRGLLLDKSSSAGKKAGVIEHCMEKQLQCHFCDYRTFWKADLKNHLSEHHEAELKQQDGIRELLDFTSQLCDSANNDNCDSRTCYEQHCFVDDNKDDLVDYNMNIEVNDTEFMSKTEGSLASLFFKSKSLRICPLPDCKFVSETPSKLKIHLESHDTLKRFMCMHCGKRFSWLWDIRRHVRHSHPGVDMTIRELSDEEANSSESFAEFNTPDEERVEGKLHVNILEEGLRFENSPEMSALSNKELHITTSPKTDSMDVERLAEQYANEVAAMFYGGSSSSYPENSSTSLVQGLDQGLRTTSAQISVKKKFGRPSKSLLMTRFRPFKCSECGRRSNWRWDLNKHIRTSHPGAHLIELTETEAKVTFHEVLHRDFREKQPLTQLEESDGAKFKPYMCNICGYRSNWKCDVNKHIKTLHSFAHIITLSDEQTKAMVTEYDVKHDPFFEVASNDTPLDKGLIPLTSSCVTVDGHKLKRFKCSVCPYRSNFRSDVGRHIRHKHDKRTSRIIVMNENEAAETLKEYMETWARKKFVSSPSKKRPGFNRHHYGQSLLSMATKEVVDKKEQINMICGFKSKSRNEIIEHWQHRQRKNMNTSLPNFKFHSVFEARIARQPSEYLSAEDTKENVSESLDSSQSKRVLNVESGTTIKKLSCNICPYETNRSGLLNIHKIYHHPSGRNKYKCRYCPYFVNSSRLLHQHMCLHLMKNNDKSIENSKRNALKTAKSFQQGSSPLLLSRMRVPVRKTYLCAKCPYTSTNRNDYLYHRQFHLPCNTPSFRCNQCPYYVNQKCLLVQHSKVHRKKFQYRDVTVITMGPNSKGGLQSKTETGRLQDIEVGLDYSNINSRAIVQSSSRKEAKSLKNADYEMGREQNIDESCESHYDEVKKAYCCQMCPYSNARRDHLMCHMKFHLNKSSLKCPHCSYSVSRVHLINQHLKVHGLCFPSTQSANVSKKEFAHSIHQKKARHHMKAKNQLPTDSQTSFVVRLSKKLKTLNLLPSSSSNCSDGNSSSNAEQQLKKIFMHKLRLQSSILPGQDNRLSTAADRLCTQGHSMQEDQSIFSSGPGQTLHDLDG